MFVLFNYHRSHNGDPDWQVVENLVIMKKKLTDLRELDKCFLLIFEYLINYYEPWTFIIIIIFALVLDGFPW